MQQLIDVPFQGRCYAVVWVETTVTRLLTYLTKIKHASKCSLKYHPESIEISKLYYTFDHVRLGVGVEMALHNIMI